MKGLGKNRFFWKTTVNTYHLYGHLHVTKAALRLVEFYSQIFLAHIVQAYRNLKASLFKHLLTNTIYLVFNLQ